MAETEKDNPQAAAASSEADKARARQWFKKAADCRERREYDYAVECCIKGLEFWPEATEEGHMPLRSLALQRQQAGGKKPGLMDGMKRSMTSKDAKKNMLNAEQLLAMDPYQFGYAEGLLKNANKGGFLETCKWVAPLILDILKKDKKPNRGRFTAYRDALVEAAEQAAERNDTALETQLLELAVNSLDYLALRLPGDDPLRNDLRDLAGRLTIARGKYGVAEDFRESLHNGEKQKLLHDSDRMRQAEDSLEALIAAARKEYEAAPQLPAKIYALVDMLLKAEREGPEKEAIGLLMKSYEDTQNYSFKLRADDVRLRQLSRQTNRLVARARETGAAEDRQQARLASLEQRQTTLEIFRERAEKYPTDLRFRYKLGTGLFDAGEYDEAIPVLQVAQADPRHRVYCQLLLGRAFFEKGSTAQAAEVLREALEKYDLVDETSKKLLYWLGRAYEAGGNAEEAKAAYGKLLRQDYNYMDGDARKRLESLK